LAALPPGSDVRFVTPTIWDVYHRHIIVGSLAVVVVQAVLITGLLRQRARLRLAEQTIRAREATLRTSYERIQQMAGRLINAQEAARAGVAQDLHDDVCQQLVFVSMGVSTLKSSTGQLQDGKTQEALATLEADSQKVFEGLRRLSQDLHPATLRLLGLAAALRTHCAEMAKHHGVDCRSPWRDRAISWTSSRGTTVRVRGPAALPGQDALTDASAQADAAEAAPITQKLKVN